MGIYQSSLSVHQQSNSLDSIDFLTQFMNPALDNYIKLIDMGIVSPLWVALFPRLGAMACLEIKMSKSKQESKHVYTQFSLLMEEIN